MAPTCDNSQDDNRDIAVWKASHAQSDSLVHVAHTGHIPHDVEKEANWENSGDLVGNVIWAIVDKIPRASRSLCHDSVQYFYVTVDHCVMTRHGAAT